MPLDLNKLIHIGDFNFNSAALGALRCGPSGDKLENFRKMARDNVDGETIARAIILCIVRKCTGDENIDAVAGGPPVTETEVALLTKDELDSFCDLFITRRLQTLPGSNTSEDDAGHSQGPIPAGCAELGPAIIAHADAERAQMERILGKARESILGGTAAAAMRKLHIGGALERIRRDTLGLSAIEAAGRTIKASDNLGQTIAALRASEAAAKSTAFPAARPAINLEALKTATNPTLETNDLLRKQQAYAEEMRPTLIRSAELIQTLTDTTLATQALANANSSQAERHAQRSMMVAIMSVIIAVITGGISIYYANASPTAVQADQIAKDLRMQLSAVVASAQADRAASEKKAADDHAILAAVVARQSELIKQMRAASEKASQPRTGASK